MSRLAVAVAAVLLLAAPASGVAKEKIEPRMAAMLACGSVTPSEERLRCYDQAASTLRQALDQGELVLEEKSRPSALEGVVKATGAMGNNRYWVELDSGDRWQVFSTSNLKKAPATGVKVKLRKGAFGNYWLSDPSSTGRRSLYLGRSS